ncbi:MULTISPECIES: recombinase family protein [Enterobacteriaceae]|uniref:Recombinase family protein n=1 Tax=Enterobacter asburiae TaxID=61645 RepID=A0A7W3HGS6_ENTAS|nr:MULTISPECIES: recombinase family protein [Enterobacteriaceae]MBA7984644.1 recombinase family protein [Enterobacter asburiae]MBA8079232.1 recombinase family protein [Enterobacter asburiae]MEB7943551.1 recombinase family protein [Raoultella ornithinolytica]QMB04819.1 recombinase family protein [Citrobacter freundii]
MKYGYVRVSTKEQNTARQEAALEGLCDELLTDTVSGKNTDRPQLQALLRRVRAGDEVVVKSVDRLARNTKDLLTILDELLAKGVTVRFIDNSLEFSDNPTSRFMITMLGAVGELERSFIRQRQTEGIAVAKTEGKFKGRSKDEALRDRVKKLLERGLNNAEIAKVAGCGVATVYRIKREIQAEV